MANEGDLGHKAEEFFRDVALAEAKRRASRFYYTGLCWNCSAPLESGSFCPDDGCAEDYEKRERMKK